MPKDKIFGRIADARQILRPFRPINLLLQGTSCVSVSSRTPSLCNHKPSVRHLVRLLTFCLVGGRIAECCTSPINPTLPCGQATYLTTKESSYGLPQASLVSAYPECYVGDAGQHDLQVAARPSVILDKHTCILEVSSYMEGCHISNIILPLPLPCLGLQAWCQNFNENHETEARSGRRHYGATR